MPKEIEKFIYRKTRNNPHFAVHVRLAARYAGLLAAKYGVSREKAVAGALLHDIDGIIADSKTPLPRIHEMLARRLRRWGYNENFIAEMFGVILTHGTHSKIKPRTMLEKIVASADGLSHYDMIPLYFYANGQRGHDFPAAIDNVKAKLERSKNKLYLAEARKLAKPLQKRAEKIIGLVETTRAGS